MPPTPEFVHAHREILERHTDGFRIGEFLGKGAWGSAFESDDPAWMVKITKDFQELFAAQLLAEFRRQGRDFPGVVETWSAETVRNLEDDGETLFVIVRERVEPVEAAWKGRQDLLALDGALYIIEERQAYPSHELAEAWRDLERLAPRIGEVVKSLQAEGHEPIDLSVQNVGLTCRERLGAPAGTPVIFDFSFSEKEEA